MSVGVSRYCDFEPAIWTFAEQGGELVAGTRDLSVDSDEVSAGARQFRGRSGCAEGFVLKAGSDAIAGERGAVLVQLRRLFELAAIGV